MLYDSYGFKHSQTAFYFARKGTPARVEDAGDGVCYIAYTGSGNDLDKCAIWRVQTTDGVTDVRWAIGAWDDRASLEYTATPDQPINA